MSYTMNHCILYSVGNRVSCSVNNKLYDMLWSA